ncbi:MAG TPA: hypothetical protein PKZ25_11120, partial [Candidatus Hydrogenedentes bacterium]|nr:hypothetical protein [Candidatus Hydrogenedentota bacterium]
QLLRRQKVFRLIKEFDTDEGESRIALFADRIGNRFIEVGDPGLSYQELEAGRQALLQRLRELETVQTEGEPPSETRTDEAKTDSMETAHEAAG